MPIRNIVSCTRQPNRAIFSFVNLFAGCQHYRVVMDFLPSGIVNIIVGGALYRCQANKVKRLIDESRVEHEGLASLNFSIQAGELSFHIPADVYEQLKAHPEFENYSIIDIGEG